jgi:hypothetical protein
MDNSPYIEEHTEVSILSYDNAVAYEDQLPQPDSVSLANRIGNTKIYLLSESSVARVGKVRR